MKAWKRIAALMMFACALFSCACAQELTLPAALTSISEEAFMQSTAFETAVLPDGLKRIEAKAFAECMGLRVVYMPSSVEYIAPDAFEGCENLHFVCEAGSYAALYAQGTDFISFGPADKIPVTLATDVLLAERNTPITWTVNSSQRQAEDRYTLTVYLNGEVYAAYSNLDPAEQSSVTATLADETGLVYALCSYIHANGETTQVLSETTQLAGEMRARLVCADPFAYCNEQAVWVLTVEEAAGTALVDFTAYMDGNDCLFMSPDTQTQCSVLLEESGVYRVDAVITDGLGRTLAVTGNEVTVSETSALSGSQDLFYRLSGESYIVESCSTDAVHVAIPDERNGIPITAIADGAFMLCNDLSTVTLGQNVQTIGDYAFHGCLGLSSVSLPDTLSSIGEGAFSACENLTGLKLPSALQAVPDYLAEGSGLMKLELPSNVTAVGQSAFADCERLSSVTLNEGLSRLGANAFENCTSLSEVNFPESLTVLSAEAFSGCSALRELNFAQTLASIGERAFGSCSGLVDVIVPQSVSSVGTSAFAGCFNLKTVTFENINASIGEDAFAYCPEVEVRTFGSGAIESQLKKMGVAFRNTALVILTKLECLTRSPMAGSSMLWQIEPAWGIAPYTYQYAVYCGDELQTQSEKTYDTFFQHVPEKSGDYFLRVTVSDSNGCVITKDSAMVAVAPADGATLEYLTYELNDEATGYVITKISGLPKQDTKVVIPAYIDGVPVVEIDDSASGRAEYLTEVVIPDTVTSIGGNAFSRCPRLKKVTLGSGVKILDDYAFAYCDHLETINLPYGLEEIDKYAFRDCPMLKNVEIPSTVTKVEEYIFGGCTSLTQMTVPVSITTVGNGMFEGCTQLQFVEWNVTNRRVPYHTFSSCTNLDTVTFGYAIEYFDNYSFAYSGIRQVKGDLSKVEDINEAAFLDCTRLESLTLPAKVTYIRFKKNSMRGCTSLFSIELDENAILSAGEQAFMGCSSLSSLYCKVVQPGGASAFAHCTSLLGVKLNGTTANAFDGCTSLLRITFTGGVYVNRYCFRNCTSLKSVSYLKEWEDEEIKYWGITIDHHAFQNCTSLVSFSTPSPSNLDIEAYAFENCTSLSSVSFPAERGGSHVGEGAFRNCTSLSSVSGLNNLTSIGDQAFKNCTALSSLSFEPIVNKSGSTHNNLTIGNEAFANCYNLTSASFDEYTTEFGAGAFAGCSKLTATVVPGSAAAAYFSGGSFGVANAGMLPLSLSADIQWGKTNADGSAEAYITLWNTKDGPVPNAGSELINNSATQNLTVTLKTNNANAHTVELAEEYALPTAISYQGSVTLKVLVKCLRTNSSSCVHSDSYVSVKMTADNSEDYSITFPIKATFPQQYSGDWYITEPTVITSHTEVGGNVYVENELTIQGGMLDCAQNIVVRLGGTINMEGSAVIRAQNVQVKNGGGIDLRGGSSIRADSVSNEGALSISADAVKMDVTNFSVVGSGVLNFAADGQIKTDTFTFNTSIGHAALLTNGVIIAREAELRQGFHASNRQVFILQGSECTLDVSRTSPRQHFAGLTIDCKVEGLTVSGVSSLLGNPFECDRFVMTEKTLEEEIVNSNTVAKEIYDKATAARLEAMTEAEKELSKAMAKWYAVSPNLGESSIQNKREIAEVSTYAEKAILGWVVEIASGMPDKWSSVNDVLRSLLASGTHGVYTFEDGGKTYEVCVKPVGGLTMGSVAATVGQITVETGGKSYEFVYSLNQHGIRQSGDMLLEVIRDYGRDEYVNAMNKAIEEAVGKENAKFALGVVKVIETSLIEERSLLNVIAGKYGKTVAKELISQKYPKVKQIIEFYNKWDKYLSQNKKITGMISEVRNGETLPNDLMKEFLNLKKVIP